MALLAVANAETSTVREASCAVTLFGSTYGFPVLVSPQ
jgi:hypothetical protein